MSGNDDDDDDDLIVNANYYASMLNQFAQHRREFSSVCFGADAYDGCAFHGSDIAYLGPASSTKKQQQHKDSKQQSIMDEDESRLVWKMGPVARSYAKYYEHDPDLVISAVQKSMVKIQTMARLRQQHQQLVTSSASSHMPPQRTLDRLLVKPWLFTRRFDGDAKHHREHAHHNQYGGDFKQHKSHEENSHVSVPLRIGSSASSMAADVHSGSSGRAFKTQRLLGGRSRSKGTTVSE
jgi:hypothetical protein